VIQGKIREVPGARKAEAERQVKQFEKAAGSAFTSAARAAGSGKPAKKQKAARRNPKSRLLPVIAKR